MDKKLKTALKTAYIPPAPQGKQDFLQNLSYPRASWTDFLCMQLRYTRKRVWLSYVFAALALLFMSARLPAGQEWLWQIRMLWMMSAILPVVALFTVGELFRSSSFGMAELEMSCKYSLSQATMAKITLFGLCNVALLPVCLVYCGKLPALHLLQSAVYLVTPYLLTCAGSLAILRRYRGREGVYGCGVLAFVAAVLPGMADMTFRALYQPQYFWMWGVLCLLCLGGIGVQLTNCVKSKEILQWSL